MIIVSLAAILVTVTLLAISLYLNIRFGGESLKSDTEVDITKWKEEDITNIRKEETPIVRELGKRQTKSFLLTFALVILIGLAAGIHELIPNVMMIILASLLAIGTISAIIYNMRIAHLRDKIIKWQKEQRYKEYEK